MVLIVLLGLFYIVGIPIWLILLSCRVSTLEEAAALHEQHATDVATTPTHVPVHTSEETLATSTNTAEEKPAVVMAESVSPASEPLPSPEPEPAAVPATNLVAEKEDTRSDLSLSDTSSEKRPVKEDKKPISFVELFSWIGGFILLLGIIFAIKYALENNLISPALRIAIGTITGLVLWGVGLYMKNPRTKVTADTLCACGSCICYSIWFAAYHFYQMTSPVVAFALLSLVALASFATAAWKNAKYIGILAQIIGFLTPALFRTQTPHIWAFLAYMGLINISAICTAVKRGWTEQLFTSLGFTTLGFLAITGSSDLIQLACFPGVFALLYTATAVQRKNMALLGCAFALASLGLLILGGHVRGYDTNVGICIAVFAGFFAMLFAFIAQQQKQSGFFFGTIIFTVIAFLFLMINHQFGLLLGFIFLMATFFTGLSAFYKNRAFLFGSFALTVLGFLCLYTNQIQLIAHGTSLPWLTGFAAVFCLLFAFISYKQQNQELLICTMGLATLYLCCVAPLNKPAYILSFTGVSTAVFAWLATAGRKQILLMHINLIFCMLGVFLTGLTASYWVSISSMLILGAFHATIAIRQKSGSLFAELVGTMSLPLLVIFSRYVLSISYAEIFSGLALWTLLVLLIPCIFKQLFLTSKPAWIAAWGGSSLGSILLLIAASRIHNVSLMALALAALYGAMFMWTIDWQSLEDNLLHQIRSSCFIANVAVLLTLWMGLELRNEYLTLALTAAGLGLIGLWHRYKVPVSQPLGAFLLGIVLVRLLCNPLIAHYHAQNAPLFNWYLYVYLFCAAVMYAAARLWKMEPASSWASVFKVAGGTLIFALINIEIANYFSGGNGLPFHFCGEVSEAAAYTIAWTVYGAGLMFWKLLSPKKHSACLVTGLVLVGIALSKLFLSDIWQVPAGTRILLLIAVACVMIAISFLYQQLSKQPRTEK